MAEIYTKLIAWMGADDSAAYSAWVSTARDTNRSEEEVVAMIERLAKEGHLGCFEHQTATFEIHAPIFVARQIQRHRTFSFNELSGRYKDFRNQQVYLPHILDDSKDVHDLVDKCLEMYKYLRELGVNREDARVILPLGTMTRFRMTGNLRNWNHFLSLRMSEHAQEETMWLAMEIYSELEKIWPISMGMLRKFTW